MSHSPIKCEGQSVDLGWPYTLRQTTRETLDAAQQHELGHRQLQAMRRDLDNYSDACVLNYIAWFKETYYSAQVCPTAMDTDNLCPSSRLEPGLQIDGFDIDGSTRERQAIDTFFDDIQQRLQHGRSLVGYVHGSGNSDSEPSLEGFDTVVLAWAQRGSTRDFVFSKEQVRGILHTLAKFSNRAVIAFIASFRQQFTCDVVLADGTLQRGLLGVDDPRESARVRTMIDHFFGAIIDRFHEGLSLNHVKPDEFAVTVQNRMKGVSR